MEGAGGNESNKKHGAPGMAERVVLLTARMSLYFQVHPSSPRRHAGGRRQLKKRQSPCRDSPLKMALLLNAEHCFSLK